MNNNTPVKEKKPRWWECFKKFKGVYFLEIVLIIVLLLIGGVAFLTNNTSFRINLYVVLFFVVSWLVTSIVVDIIVLLLKGRSFPNFQKRFPKKPAVFEYAFFLGLFWATAILTDAYSRPQTTIVDFLNFLNTFGAAIFVYGFASACGWFHYIEHLDD